MKIGYLYNFTAFPPKGGNHVHALELAQGFMDAGHVVCVMDDPTMPRASNFDSANQDDLEVFAKSIDILYVRVDARLMRDWHALSLALKLLPNTPIVWEINSPSNEMLAYSWLGGRRLSSGGSEGFAIWVRRWLHALRKLPIIWLEENHRKRLAKSCSAAICVSSSLGRYALDLGINNILVLPNGGPCIPEAEILERRKRRLQNTFTVFYSGSAMYPWQGLDFLAEVIRLAAQKAPDIRFVLAVNQRTSDLPTSPNVEVREHLNRTQILDAICTADACVSLHPVYTWSRYGFHNSPMKLFEYMACMCPVVASNHGQMKELINHEQDGLLCENTAEDILNKLLWLRDNPKPAQIIGRNGWQRIQTEFSWKANVDQTLALFDKLVGPATR